MNEQQELARYNEIVSKNFSEIPNEKCSFDLNPSVAMILLADFPGRVNLCMECRDRVFRSLGVTVSVMKEALARKAIMVDAGT